MPAVSWSLPSVGDTFWVVSSFSWTGSAPYWRSVARSYASELAEVAGDLHVAGEARLLERGRGLHDAVEHDRDLVLRRRLRERLGRELRCNFVPPESFRLRSTHVLPAAGTATSRRRCPCPVSAAGPRRKRARFGSVRRGGRTTQSLLLSCARRVFGISMPCSISALIWVASHDAIASAAASSVIGAVVVVGAAVVGVVSVLPGTVVVVVLGGGGRGARLGGASRRDQRQHRPEPQLGGLARRDGGPCRGPSRPGGR